MTLLEQQIGLGIRIRALDSYIESLEDQARTAQGEHRVDLLLELLNAAHARRELLGEVA